MRCKCCNSQFKTSMFVVRPDGADEDLCPECRVVVRMRENLDYKWYQFEGIRSGISEINILEE